MTIRYLALGDSYTIGESVTESARFPSQLATQLQGKGMATDVMIVARTGWTTDELRAAIARSNLKPPYDLVTLLIGVNNQYRGYDIEAYRGEFRDLLTQAMEFASDLAHRVIVVSIPDWGITPFAGGRDEAQIANEIDAYNVVNREESTLMKVPYVDVTAISRRAKKDRSLLAEDGLHPSGKMYGLWVELLVPLALQALDTK